MSSVTYSCTYASDVDKLLLELTAAAQSISLTTTLESSSSDRTSLVKTSTHTFSGQVTEHVGVSIVTSLEILWPSSLENKEKVKSWLETTDLSVLHLLRSKDNHGTDNHGEFKKGQRRIF
jgi:hypothetical protein